MARALVDRDTEVISRLAWKQADAGADFLDLCAAGVSDESATLQWLAETAQNAVDIPFSLDTHDLNVLRRVLPLCRRPPLLNCFSGALSDRVEIFAVLRDYSHLPIVALCLDERGPLTSAVERVAVAHRLAEQ